MKAKQIWSFIGIVMIISFGLGVLIHFNTIMTALGIGRDTIETTQRVVTVRSVFTEIWLVLLSHFLLLWSTII